MKKCKKLGLWLLMLLLVFSLTACGEEKDTEDEDDDKRTESVQEDDEKDDDEESEEVSKTVESEETKEEEPESTEAVAEVETEVVPEETEPIEEEDEDSSEAKAVLENMIKASQENPMTSADLLLDLQMNMAMEGMSLDLGMKMDGDYMYSADPYTAYAKFVMELNVLGETQKMEMDTYIAEEDGVIYNYTNSEGVWSKVDSGLTLEDALSNQYGYAWLEKVSDVELKLDKEDVNGKEAYKLNMIMTGNDIINLATTMTESVAEMEEVLGELETMGIDMSAISVDVTYYVDAENYQVSKIEMKMLGLDSLLEDIMALGAAQTGEEMNYTMSISKCDMAFDNISYEPVEIPALPQEALDAAVVSEEF